MDRVSYGAVSSFRSSPAPGQISWFGVAFVVRFTRPFAASRASHSIYSINRNRPANAGTVHQRPEMNRVIAYAVIAPVVLATFLPVSAAADPVVTEATRGADNWNFGAFVYVYYATIGTQATLPNGSTSTVTIDAKDLYNHLKFGVLGSFAARKGNWGVYSDLLYMNVGEFNSHYHNLIIGGSRLPADVSSSTNFEMKSVVWTLAGTYRAIATELSTVDLIAGARLFDERIGVDWTLNGNIGTIPAPGRAGTVGTQKKYVDGLIGLIGRVSFGANRTWFLPYYVDIGTGESKLTWQLTAGLGYAFKWGELIGAWRHVDYEFKSGSEVSSTNFDGPMLGAAFLW
jgi:hypothetical protein